MVIPLVQYIFSLLLVSLGASFPKDLREIEKIPSGEKSGAISDTITQRIDE